MTANGVGDGGVEVLLVGYFPETGAIAELFATIAASLAVSTRVAVLAPEHLSLAGAPVAADFRFPFSSRRPHLAVVGQGLAAHRAAQELGPTATLFFTQHPLNIFASRLLRRSRRVLWWHEPEARGQARRVNSLAYGAHDRIVVPRSDRIVVASASVRRAVPDEVRARTFVVPFPRPTGFDSASTRFDSEPTDLLFFGKLASYKGLDVVAAAMEELADRGITPSLRVLGAGDLEGVAPRLAALRRTGSSRIEHVDEYAPAADVASALRASRACLLPYLTAAGSSTIAIAGLHQATLLASEVGSFGDFLVDGETALLFPAGDSHALANQIEAVMTESPRVEGLGDRLAMMSTATFDPMEVSDELRSVLLDATPSTRLGRVLPP